MSSFYPDLFKSVPSSRVRSWVWQVNQHGDAVMYALDGDGKPASFVAGPLYDMLAGSVASMGEYSLMIAATKHVHPYLLVGCHRWREVPELLAGPRIARRIKAEAVYDFGFRYFKAYLTGHPPKLTELAREWDAAADEEEAEARSRRATSSPTP